MSEQALQPEKDDFQSGGLLVPSSAQLGLWTFLATVTMLFAAFTSAYLVRRAGPDWHSIVMPKILWLNTVILLLSSGTLEVARIRKSAAAVSSFWLLATTLLGLGFLGGQLVAWRQLMALGVYIPTNPHSSFFYMLTGLHGLHLLSGLAFLIYGLVRAGGGGSHLGESEVRVLIGLCATYWHFLAALWLFLFLMLFFW
ncbi:MAG: cytochrome c oxidase subunit 3 [Acidobacteriota bacterium]